MTDKQYANMFDDKEYLKSLGGAKKVKSLEIKNNYKRANDYEKYAKDWARVYDNIGKITTDKKVSNKKYKKMINNWLQENY